MRRPALGLAALALFLALTDVCLAHKVNVFAFVDGDAVQVECGFSKSRRVRNGKVTVSDPETGETIVEGTTDERGRFRFRPSDEFLAAGRGLNIRLDAGEGHRDEWKISAEELRALAPRAAGAAAPPEGKGGEPPRRQAPPAAGAALSGIDRAELEEMMGRVVDERLSPIRLALARREEDGPGLRDIVGGVGWILGLLGLAAYLKYRREK